MSGAPSWSQSRWRPRTSGPAGSAPDDRAGGHTVPVRRTTIAALIAVPLFLVLLVWLQLSGRVELALLLLAAGVLALVALGVREAVRGHRRAATALGLVALAVVGAVAWYGWSLNATLGDIDRAPDTVLGVNEDQRPERTPTEALNLLLMGADDEHQLVDKPSIAEMLADDDWIVGNYRSDTLMFVHVPADRSSAYVVSIPRDTYTTVYDAEGTPEGKDKINAAFSTHGPYATWRTVEQLSGVRVDHMAVIDYRGFRDLTTALGGVDVYVPETVTDTQMGKTWTRGWHHLEGNEALLYVRMRHGFSDGDFSRIDRQQNFLRTLLAKVVDDGTVANPVRFRRTVAAIAGQLTVDESWSAGDIRSLALSMRGIDPDRIVYLTLPLDHYEDTAAGSSVIVDEKAVRELFRAVESDRVCRWVREHPDYVLPDPNKVS